MTTGVNASVNNVDLLSGTGNSSKKTESKPFFGRVYEMVSEGFACGGLIGGDLPNAMRLSKFYSECLNGGVASQEACAVTDAGALFKNYVGVLELPKKIFGPQGLVTDFQKLANGTVQSVLEFTASFFNVTKSMVDGLEVGGSMGLVGKDVIATYKPFGLAGTASFGAREVLSQDIPNIRNNWSQDRHQVTFSLLKLIKNVSLVAVGCLALSAIFFKAVFAPWIIPVLLTASVTTSLTSRFFKGLVMESPASKPVTV